MKTRIRYTEAPKDVEQALLHGKRVVDFLPPPDQLRRARVMLKITIALNQTVVDFFKQQAEITDVKYQTMINEVLEQYVGKYSEMEITKPRV